MPEEYTFTGHQLTGYMSYADLETGKMLQAEPGKAYSMRAVEEGLPVPPGDGLWEEAPTPKKAPAKETANTADGGDK